MCLTAQPREEKAGSPKGEVHHAVHHIQRDAGTRNIFFVRRLQGLGIRAWQAHVGGYERSTDHHDLRTLPKTLKNSSHCLLSVHSRTGERGPETGNGKSTCCCAAPGRTRCRRPRATMHHQSAGENLPCQSVTRSKPCSEYVTSGSKWYSAGAQFLSLSRTPMTFLARGAVPRARHQD